MTDIVLGTGPLGMAVMKALLERGRRVTMVNTSGRADVPEGVRVLKADLYRPESAEDVMRGADTVYHCVAPPYHRWPELFGVLQESVVGAAAKTGVSFVYADNLYMYGEGERELREELPNRAATRKGAARARAADMVLEAHRKGNIKAAIVRGSDFYGPGVLSSTVGERLFLPLLAGKPCTMFGNPDQPHTYTYIRDFGRALAEIGLADDAYGQVWFAPNAETLTTRQFVDLAYEVAGFTGKGKIRRMGRLTLCLGGLFIPAARESVEMLYQHEQPFIVDSGKFAGRFGFAGTPLKEALAETVAWYRSFAAAKGQ